MCLLEDEFPCLRLAPRLKNATAKFGISPHLPKEMQMKRQQVMPIKREAIENGKKAVIKTVGTDIKLFIDNKLYVPQ